MASKNIENIKIGIENQLWAVGTLLNQQSMAGRTTKAMKYLRPGDCGLLYCNPLHAFTTPFIAQSFADPEDVVNDVWQESWVLPFKIKTLGDLSRSVTGDEAKVRWDIVRKRSERNNDSL